VVSVRGSGARPGVCRDGSSSRDTTAAVKARSIAALGLSTLVFAGTFVVVGACSTANMTTYAPVDEKTKYSADILLSAAEKAAEDQGFRVVAGEGSSTFDTREKEVATSSIPRLSYKYTFHVETTSGQLVINSTCSKNSSTSEAEFSDCGDDRPALVVQQQAALRKHILERAKLEQERSPDFGGFGETEHEAADAGTPAPKGEDKASAAEEKSADDKDSPPKGKAKASRKKK
jgi:hypothetical protein